MVMRRSSWMVCWFAHARRSAAAALRAFKIVTKIVNLIVSEYMTPGQLPEYGKVSGMEPGLLFVGTPRRAHRTDPADVAFGIYAFRSERGRLHALGMTATPQPGWITMHPGGRFLYVA